MTDNDPIVSAVLEDPVVQAALSHPAAAMAVADAMGAPPPADSAEPTGKPTKMRGQAGQVGRAQDRPDVMILPGGQPVAAPTTTEEEDRATVGQRRINLIWEVTQALVAISVTVSTLAVTASLALRDPPDISAFILLSNVFFLVMSTYFQRTNHTKTGGVGKNDIGR